MRRRRIAGVEVDELIVSSRAGRPVRPARLKALGYRPHEVDSKGRIRTWEAPDGRVVSKFRAYKEIGLPMVNRREWERIDSFEGRERATALRKRGFRLKRDAELY